MRRNHIIAAGIILVAAMVSGANCDPVSQEEFDTLKGEVANLQNVVKAHSDSSHEWAEKVIVGTDWLFACHMTPPCPPGPPGIKPPPPPDQPPW